MSIKSDKKTAIVHTLAVPLPQKQMYVSYFPDGLSDFLLNMEKEEQCLFTGNFRSFLLSAYPEVISAFFSNEVYQKKEPWLYVDVEASVSTIQSIYRDFLNHLAIQLQKEKKPFPDFLLKEKAGSTLVSTSEMAHSKHFLKVCESILCIDFAKRCGNFFDIQAWYTVHNGDVREVMSRPFTPNDKVSKGASDMCSYVISPRVVSCENEQLKVSLHYSLRRWVIKPIDFKDFARDEKRSIYLHLPEFNQTAMIRFRIGANKKEISFHHAKLTSQRLTEIGYSIDLQAITKMPHSFYFGQSEYTALIPYRPQDKEKRNVQDLHVGLSEKEKNQLRDFWMSTFENSLLAMEVEIVPTLPVSIPGGRTVPEWTSQTRAEIEGKRLVISVYTKKTKETQSLIRDALKRLEQPEKYINNKHLASNFRFIEIDELVFDAVPYKGVNDIPYFQLAFDIKTWDSALFGPLSTIEEESEDPKKIRKEILAEEFRKTTKGKSIDYNIIEIGAYGTQKVFPQIQSKKEKESDPKRVIVEELLKYRNLTQMFHGEEVSDSVFVSCIKDILSRKGFVNQLYREYNAKLEDLAIYCPVALPSSSKKKGYFVYAVSRLLDGHLHIKYKDSPWLSLEESLTYLTRQKQRALSENVGFVAFYEHIVRKDNHAKPLVLLDYASLIHFKTMFSFDPAIPIVQYDVDSSRSPVITLLDAKGNESKGTALLKSKDVYYSVAPKMPTDTKTNSSQTKLENNVFFVSRVSGEVRVINGGDKETQIKYAEIYHLLRNLTLTFASFTNRPYPAHIFKYHREIIYNE